MTIDIAVVLLGLVPLGMPLPLLLYSRGGEVTRNVIEQLQHDLNHDSIST
jgi:hypothetical protein